jgi:hypothetical protein
MTDLEFTFRQGCQIYAAEYRRRAKLELDAADAITSPGQWETKKRHAAKARHALALAAAFESAPYGFKDIPDQIEKDTGK